MSSENNQSAIALFGGISPHYDRWAEVFSIFQYRRWHAALLTALHPEAGERVLDVSTGTGAVAWDLAASGCSVVGLDISRDMLQEALRRRHDNQGRLPAAGSKVHFVEGRAEDLPFPPATFDAVTFTFLLRYVADPLQPLSEINRVLRGGGRAAMLEFAIPTAPVTRALWSFYAFILLPLITRPISPGWARVGSFLGGSIASFYQRYPLEEVIDCWRRAGFANVRYRVLSVGGATIVSGERP